MTSLCIEVLTPVNHDLIVSCLNNTVEEQTKQIAELQEQLTETPTSKISRRIGDSVWGIIGGVALAVVLYFIGRYFGISL